MPEQCELCGEKSDDLVKSKVSGAEIYVCPGCSSHGQAIETSNSDDTETKYSTNSKQKEKKNTGSGSQSSHSGTSDSESKDDVFEDVSDLALDYGDIIKEERNNQGISREDLAEDLGIKESHLRNIESERTQPSLDLQKKIESSLEIDLGLSDGMS